MIPVKASHFNFDKIAEGLVPVPLKNLTGFVVDPIKNVFARRKAKNLFNEDEGYDSAGGNIFYIPNEKVLSIIAGKPPKKKKRRKNKKGFFG